jgi:predicted anti-sigma-YlaC factor YlaD
VGIEDEITCKEIVELVTDYLESAMSEPDRARFDRHLSICPGCVNYLDQMRETIRVTGALTEESLSSAVKADLLTAFRDWKRGATTPS